MIRNTSLWGAVDQYLVYRRLQQNSAYQLRRTLQLYEGWLERSATVDDLVDDQVSRWLARLEMTHAQRTVAGHRGNLLTLWRDCADRGLCAPPRRVRRVPRPDPCPVSWTMDELRAIVAACGQVEGLFRRTHAPRCVYLSTLVKFCYESGLRRSDVWRVDRSQVRPDGSIVLCQHKTARAHTPRIMADTYEGFTALPGDRPLACPYESDSSFYGLWNDAVIARAKVRPGALQQIRRTGATHLAIAHPHAVQRYLGHRTATMQRHYVDLSIAAPQAHLPPPLTV